MVIWVAQACSDAVGRENVIVATEDRRISSVVRSFGYRAVMTSPRCLTGTDRVAEVAVGTKYLTYLNVQGDEPLVRPEDIKRIAEHHQQTPSVVFNGYCSLESHENPISVNIPKVVVDTHSRLLYVSRSPIPGTKYPLSRGPQSMFRKQVCIYAYSGEHLKRFASEATKTPLEASEDIEILRFIEIGETVRMVETSRGSVAVDVPADVEMVEEIMRKRGFTLSGLPKGKPARN